MKAVVVEGGIAGSPMLAHPATERYQYRRIFHGWLHDRGREKTDTLKAADEQACTLLQITPFCPTIAFTPASTEMADKFVDGMLTESLRQYALSAGPIEQVLRGSNVPASRDLRKACLA
jgi:hypothetical protein